MNLDTEIKSRSSRLAGFHKLSLAERKSLLARQTGLTSEEIEVLAGAGLKPEQADLLVENALGTFGLPLGLATNFLVNGKDYLVPMAIEEASVVAAASKAAKIIRASGGFETEVDEPIMIGQVQILNLEEPEKAAVLLNDGSHKEKILLLANQAIPKMVARGGGAKDLEARIIRSKSGDMLIVHLLIDVREAMGANVVNTVCEAVAPEIQKIAGGQVNLRILSNLADRRLAKARFQILINDLPAVDGYSSKEVAKRIVQASDFADADSYRAATHNKGVFNGIDAVAIALGQDWRAIEAGGHAYAARDGQYRGLTNYKQDGDYLIGTIELPMQVGWYGRVTKVHPTVHVLRKLTGITNAKELAGLLAVVGLAQNFAACLALCTEGIQKGHMPLCAKVNKR